jgi:chemotaxis response regulator CheB
MTIRVLLVDDQDLVRAGFAMVLGSQSDLTVVGEAADGAAAVRLAREIPADVMVMDVRMPGLDGVAATREICQAAERPRVLILTTFDLDEYVFAALLHISEATVETHAGQHHGQTRPARPDPGRRLRLRDRPHRPPGPRQSRLTPTSDNSDHTRRRPRLRSSARLRRDRVKDRDRTRRCRSV